VTELRELAGGRADLLTQEAVRGAGNAAAKSDWCTCAKITFVPLARGGAIAPKPPPLSSATHPKAADSPGQGWRWGSGATRIVGRNLGSCQREAERVRLLEGESADGQAFRVSCSRSVEVGPSPEFASVWPG
jgi:hypothetical protein